MAGLDCNPNRFYVYVHRRKSDMRVFYVGKGSGGRAFDKGKRNAYWHNIVNKHGYKVEFTHKEINEQKAFDLERALIARYREKGIKLCNATDGGEGASGAKRSMATRRRLSEIRKNAPNPMQGKKHRKETLKKMREIKIGKFAGTKHPRCSVTIDQVISVKMLRRTTAKTCREISQFLDISYHVVRNIVYEKSWRDVNENT